MQTSRSCVRCTNEAVGRVLASLLVMNVLLSSSGCTTNPGGGGTPPEIPPASTFVMDFGDFTEGGGAGKNMEGFDPTAAQLGVQSNWVWSAGHVAVWNVILTVTLVVPVAAYAESFQHTPRLDSTGTWIWEYDFMAGGVMHSASLHATAAGGNIEWDMFISKEGEFADVNWYSGVSNLVGTAGTWRLNQDPQNVTPFIDIEWNRDPTASTTDIKYTNAVPDGPENGGFIFFGILGGAGNDRVYQIFNKGADNQINIEWNHLMTDGRVQDPAHFGDTDWHCWDTALMDTPCAAETQ